MVEKHGKKETGEQRGISRIGGNLELAVPWIGHKRVRGKSSGTIERK